MVTGLPGTGKTTFAEALAQATESVHLSLDDEILGRKSPLGGGDATGAALDPLLSQVSRQLASGRNVVVDGALYKSHYRLPFMRLAKRGDADLRWIELHAQPMVAEARLRQQAVNPRSAVDRYNRLKDLYEPLDRSHLVLWSDQLSVEEMIMRVLDFLALPA